MASKLVRSDLSHQARPRQQEARNSCVSVYAENPLFEADTEEEEEEEEEEDEDERTPIDSPRWDLAQAIQSDSPVLVLDALARCQIMERDALIVEPKSVNRDIRAERVSHIDAMLHERFAKFNTRDFTHVVLVVSASCNRVNVVRSLLQHTNEHADQSQPINHDNAFNDACKAGCLEVAKILLMDSRVTLVDWDISVLRAASDSGHCDVVDLLVREDRINPGFDRSFASGIIVSQVTRVAHTSYSLIPN
jgi:hypothetical protein